MPQLHATPYNIDAEGFYFSDLEEYETKAATHRDRYGSPVEEYEIQFIDGDDVECDLAKAMELTQVNLARYFEILEEHGDDEEQMIKVMIAIHEGYNLDHDDYYDITVYQVDDLEKLAEHFIDEGLYGEIPTALIDYIDTERLGRDLSFEGYTEATFCGRNVVYLLS